MLVLVPVVWVALPLRLLRLLLLGVVMSIPKVMMTTNDDDQRCMDGRRGGVSVSLIIVLNYLFQ